MFILAWCCGEQNPPCDNKEVQLDKAVPLIKIKEEEVLLWVFSEGGNPQHGYDSVESDIDSLDPLETENNKAPMMKKTVLFYSGQAVNRNLHLHNEPGVPAKSIMKRLVRSDKEKSSIFCLVTFAFPYMTRKKGTVITPLIHPNSRKVRQAERQSRRDSRLDAQGKKRHAEELLLRTRFFWFREQCAALGHRRAALSSQDVQGLTELYIQRNDEELAVLKTLRNPPTGRIRQIETIKISEKDAFCSSKGITIPDMVTEDGVEILTEIWDGHADTCCVVPRIQLTRDGSLLTPPYLEGLKLKLKPVDEVREAGTSITPKKTLKFHGGRTVSVKKSMKLEEVALLSREKTLQRQKKSLKEKRKKAVAIQRGLN